MSKLSITKRTQLSNVKDFVSNFLREGIDQDLSVTELLAKWESAATQTRLQTVLFKLTDPNRPRVPPSEFALFGASIKAKVQMQLGASASASELNAVIKQQWEDFKMSSDFNKKQFVAKIREKHAALKAAYNRKMEEYEIPSALEMEYKILEAKVRAIYEKAQPSYEKKPKTGYGEFSDFVRQSIKQGSGDIYNAYLKASVDCDGITPDGKKYTTTAFVSSAWKAHKEAKDAVYTEYMEMAMSNKHDYDKRMKDKEANGGARSIEELEKSAHLSKSQTTAVGKLKNAMEDLEKRFPKVKMVSLSEKSVDESRFVDVDADDVNVDVDEKVDMPELGGVGEADMPGMEEVDDFEDVNEGEKDDESNHRQYILEIAVEMAAKDMFTKNQRLKFKDDLDAFTIYFEKNVWNELWDDEEKSAYLKAAAEEVGRDD
jgi:hypothetical protein